MSELLKNLANLPPEKRKLLEMLLKEEGVDLARSVIMPQSRETNEFPVSFAQQRLWFLDQLEPGSPLYNIPSAVRLTGDLDLGALKRALKEIVRRHESLRTTYASKNGKPVQVIAPEMTLDLPVVDLRGLPEAEREEEALRLAQEEAQRPFDLTADPMLRVRLLQLADREYVALLTMHHIASDGWSMGVLIGELAALYDAFSQGRPSPLPRLPIQYADFAVWQREWLEGKVLEEQLDYWREQLSDSPSMLALPTDRPRPAVQTARGGSYSFSLSKDLSRSLKSLGRKEEATLFMVLLAAFQTLLYRYAGQQKVNVGTPIANRNRAEIEGVIGFFVNTLVLQADFSDDPTFCELLQQVREVTLEAYAHQDLPFEMLVEELHLERDMSYSPLFQVMFTLQNVPRREQELPGLTLSSVQTHSGTSKFDLTLSVSEGAEDLEGLFEYNSDLFDAATIERMAGHFEVLLRGIVAHPDESIATLPLLTQAERQQVLFEWNDTQCELPAYLCAHEWFAAQAAQTPDEVALAFEDQELTYAQLNAKANQLAHYLQRIGVRPETLVGISVERSMDMIVGMLGVLKAGGAYVPVDPDYPSERLTFMFEDANVQVVLTQSHLLERIDTSRRTVCLDTDWSKIASEPETDPVSGAAPDNLAYVIYTSGSTGRPKGVSIEHRSLCSLIDAYKRFLQVGPGSRVLQFFSISFDGSVADVYLALLSGATLCIMPQETRLAGQPMSDFLRQEEISHGVLTPSVLAALPRAELPALDAILVGGEACLPELISKWAPGRRFINVYGPTETTVVSSWYEVEDASRVWTNVPIGRPLPNERMYILDRHLQPIPIGVPGEMYIGGIGVARGYLNRPELTTERFLADPFSQSPEARLYKTGDLARYLPDGNIEFLGRMDHQVKVRGFRIELGEIEAVLEKHSFVREAVAIVREDVPGDKRLVTYIVSADGTKPTTSELIDSLRRRLPEYMVPSALMTLDAFPLTPSGKVDREALPVPEWRRSDLRNVYVAPRTPVEELLAGLFAQVLSMERVGIHDNFFDLGGHSLLATKLVSRLRQTFDVGLPLRELFGAPTVAELARKIETVQSVSAPPIVPVPRDEGTDLPLSFGQQRLWFLDQLEPDSPMYNIPSAIRLSGQLDVEALERSLNTIIQRHEVLRTTFRTVNGQAVQLIAPELHIPLLVVDLSSLPQQEREEKARQLAAEEAQQPFDLSSGPLLRATLLRLSEEEYMALLTMHHIVSDAWSSGVLIREVAALYKAFVSGEPSPLPELLVQYADFAHWQRNWLKGEVLEAQLDYWKQQLSGGQHVLELPTDHPRPAMQTFRGGRQSFVLPRELSASLRDLSQREGSTLFMTLLAAFQTLLYRYTGQDDISVGTPIANRNWAEIEDLIGFFVNTLVMRTDLSGAPSFRELLGRVREMALGAYTHQDLPFEKLVDALQPERNLGHTPLFQVMFIIQNVPSQSLQLPDLRLSRIETDTGVSTFDLTLVMDDNLEGLRAGFEYNADLFNGVTIRRMASHFQNLLQAIVADPDRSISTLSLMAEAERQQILVDWNSTRADFALEKCAHHLFEASVERAPDAVAAIFKDQSLTYGELNARANQLAHHLQKLGVGPETLVGLCVDRSLEMIIGLLGILKAGGAYLPLDPEYPRDRLNFMVEDSQLSVLVTQVQLNPQIGKSENRKTVCLDADWEIFAQESNENPISGVTAENLAYVIYTSGSTGKPKGVMVQHRNLVNHNLAVAERFRLTSADRVLQFATINFDAALEEMFPAWWRGATVVLRTDDMLATGRDLMQLVQDYNLTVLDLPTAYWHEWVYEMSLLDASLPESLQLVIVGGEKASAERLAAWQRIPGAERVSWLNTYGPTEGTIIATAYELPMDDGAWDPQAEIPIGGPIANVKVHLLDPNLQPVPVGVPGELHIGGEAVAMGYLNRPELTAERFIPDPFADQMDLEASSSVLPRLYKTGDLARYLPDGNIEFMGRVDHQVKVRGYRVEPGEIEAALNLHDGLREAVVVAHEERGLGKRLAAYVVPVKELGPTANDLREFLRGRLPEYMVPSYFATLEDLPLTPSGKVDRRALPAPDQTRPELDVAYVAPGTEKEKTLVNIWAQALGLKQVGVNDNFFELGGDSILTIQVVARANQAGLRLTPRQIFEHPTVAGLAAVAGSGPTVQAEQGIVEGPVPLTPIQRHFFALDLPEPHHWNQALLLEVREPLQADLLERAVEHLLTHHDALRLRFERDGSAWRQINAGLEDDVPFEWVDLSELSASDQKAAIETRAAELQSSLDLAARPLVRMAYFDLGGDQPGRLLMVVHHLAIDGISWRVLLEDLQTVYLQLSRGKTVGLPPKTTSFRHWAGRLAEYARSEKVRGELSQWLAVAQNGVSRLPVDFPGGVNTEASARSVSVSLNAEETEALLREVPAAYRTEINDVLLTALVQAVARWTGSRAVLVELEGHGREDLFDDVDLSRTVGWFTTVYPVSLDLEDADGPGEALVKIKEQLRRLPNRGIGYGLLRHLCDDEEVVAQLRALPGPQVSFNYLGQFDQALPESSPFRPATESRGPDRSLQGARTNLLQINGGIGDGRLGLEWTYSENLHRPETIERLAEDYMASLRALIRHCQSPDVGGITPSDFDLADLDQKKLDKILKKLK